jgi:predicted dehydrogenase
MNIAIVGCGFVADFYLLTLQQHPELKVLGVHDRIRERMDNLARVYGLATYATLDALLADERVELVLNLTNPRDHYEISDAALDAGKHVYSEKPLAMEMADAKKLVDKARSRGLLISGAPCSILGETAQALWKAVRENRMGPVRLVYAEMDDGMVHRMPYRKWVSVSGIPWPYKDEFEIGCTLEHAGYYLNWLAAMFGPAERVTTFASTQIPDKVPGETLNMVSPDFSVAGIQFRSGVVARLTCGLVAPHDHGLRIVGDEGVMGTDECWNYRAPAYERRMVSIRRKTFLNPFKKRIALPDSPYPKPKSKAGAQSMDFARGPAEMAASLREKRACRLSPEFTLHINELALAIHHAPRDGAEHRMTTTFSPMEPMPWAR